MLLATVLEVEVLALAAVVVWVIKTILRLHRAVVIQLLAAEEEQETHTHMAVLPRAVKAIL